MKKALILLITIMASCTTQQVQIVECVEGKEGVTKSIESKSRFTKPQIQIVQTNNDE
jgi:hypothetical protein